MIALIRPIPNTMPLEEVSDPLQQILGRKVEVIELLTKLCQEVKVIELKNPDDFSSTKLEVSGQDYWIELKVMETEKGLVDSLWTDTDSAIVDLL